MKKFFYLKLSALVAAIAVAVVFTSVDAAGVSLTLNDGTAPGDAGNGGATEVTISYPMSGAYVTGTEITVSVTPSLTAPLANCGTPTTDMNGGAAGGAGAFSGFTSATSLYTVTQQTVAGTASLCLSMPFSATTPTNYSIAILAASSTEPTATSDYGAALYYVLGGNQVNVSAQVPATLSFAIRNTADTLNTNSCALGVLSLGAVNTCEYRLRIATNAANGFTTTIQGESDFATPEYATMTSIGDNTAFAAGSEAYGLSVVERATEGGRSGAGVFDQPIVEAGSYGTDSTPVPTTTAETILTYTAPFNAGAAPSTTSTSRVQHSAAIDAGTPTGNYTQTVTYRVTGSF